MDTIPITKKLIAFGSKKIYLPKFTVALIRTPRISPYHARFLVPLDFSKYDLRDYLYHAYNVRCFNIRSYVKQMPVRDTREQPRHWFRPDSKKYMTVEMEQPFVWPETPELSPWGQQERNQEVDDMIKENGNGGLNEERDRARRLRDQVKKLLKKDLGEAPAGIEEQAWREKKRKAKKQSPLEVWEARRQSKVTRSDEAEHFTVRV
ncbi:hypothetical protein T440DRAFT_384671 [Plenodomus tracheiphilus IPT5]|uniref:Large ribosomal subunit protein uL23m n=1 Tax=Plenodomus tracheiphilus IPT5 TaxID=1408161 RepID=A0A6A7BKV6_9PLEO|nr:hypothetical protein T440DRAFT_384671 [Plenodomus tracheiphilus IPT5]